MILLELFLTFFKIGAFTFGGGYAMLPFVQQEVLAHRWMTLDELVNFIAVSESTPGPFAVNIATYVGTRTAGFAGAFCATLGVILPSFVIILIIAQAYEKFRESRLVKGVMTGLRPAVVGLIGAAVVTIAESVFGFGSGAVGAAGTSTTSAAAGAAGAGGISMGARILSVILFAFSFYAIEKRKVHPVVILLIAAGAGIAAGYAGIL